MGGRRLQLQPSLASSPKGAGGGCGEAGERGKGEPPQVQPGGEPGRDSPWGGGPSRRRGSPQDGVLSAGGWKSGAGLPGRGASSSPEVQEKGVCGEGAGQ